MNCVVTAGPTDEPLDTVRRLTNFSTGQLGSDLAAYLTEKGHHVFLLRGRGSTFRTPAKTALVIEFTTVADLEQHLRSMSSQRIDVVFHAAAVGDFRFGKVWARQPSGGLKELGEGKISTRHGTLLAELLPTPKLIMKFRDWFPKAWLVGWKYEVDGDQSSAIARAKEQIVHTRTDVCVINGPAYGEGYGVLTQESEHQHLPDPPALFECLERRCRGTR